MQNPYDRWTFSRHALVFLEENAKPLFYESKEKEEIFYQWILRKFPLICTRQCVEDAPALRVGIPLSGKQRCAYLVDKNQVLSVVPPPLLSHVFPHLSPGITHDAEVYGSYCWQHCTKLRYVHPASDLDLLIKYAGESLEALRLHVKRWEVLFASKIDGEIRFKEIGDCAIAELLDTQSNSLVFKTSHSVFLLQRVRLYPSKFKSWSRELQSL